MSSSLHSPVQHRPWANETLHQLDCIMLPLFFSLKLGQLFTGQYVYNPRYLSFTQLDSSPRETTWFYYPSHLDISQQLHPNHF
jgi:hypothetical protein